MKLGETRRFSYKGAAYYVTRETTAITGPGYFGSWDGRTTRTANFRSVLADCHQHMMDRIDQELREARKGG